MVEREHQADKNSLQGIMSLLDEAIEATQRAFLFDATAETLLPVRVDAGQVVHDAGDQVGIERDGDLAATASLYANRFRIWFAVRDLFLCAKKMSQASTYSLSARNGAVELTVRVPRTFPADFRPEILFSPQYHVEIREEAPKHAERSADWWSPGISLMLAKQLIEEPPLKGPLPPCGTNLRNQG